jgi:lysophospholipase L1-like esterase
VAIAQEIWGKAAADGIQNILYLGFYNLPGLEAAAAIADPRMQQACENAPLPLKCWFIDPRYNATTGQGLPVPGMLGPDHLHPTPEGYKLLAQMIWDVKEANNIPV